MRRRIRPMYPYLPYSSPPAYTHAEGNPTWHVPNPLLPLPPPLMDADVWPLGPPRTPSFSPPLPPVDVGRAPKRAASACQHCRACKKRCDGALPRCKACQRHNIPCVRSQRRNSDSSSAQYIEQLEKRCSGLEQMVRMYESTHLPALGATGPVRMRDERSVPLFAPPTWDTALSETGRGSSNDTMPRTMTCNPTSLMVEPHKLNSSMLC